MKKTLLLVIAVLVMALTACTQYVFVPGDLLPGYDDKPSKNENIDDSAAILNYLQSPEFLAKVADGTDPTLIVEKHMESSAGTASMLSSRAVGQNYSATVTFKQFNDTAAGISIAEGSLDIDFKGTATTTGFTITGADVEVTDELSYTANGRTGTFYMSYTDGIATGTITDNGGSFTLDSITLSAPGNTTIKVNGSNVQWNDDMGSQITNGFGGGSGTEQDPYRIYNEAQFTYIRNLVPAMVNDVDGFFYFDVLDDLEFTDDMDSPAIGIFRGDIDFNNHTLSGISNALINNNLSELQKKYMEFPTAYALIENYLEGTISNLVYRPDELVSLIFMTHHKNATLSDEMYSKGIQDNTSTVTLKNVTAVGDFDEPSNNNTSCYISQAFQGYTVFEDCINRASQITSYGGAFLGGYPGGMFNDNGTNYPSYVTFDGCVNYGDITGTQAGVFIGSHNVISTMKDITEPVIKVVNCKNYGTVTGTSGVGYYFPISAGKADPSDYSWFDISTDSTNTGNDPEHIILLKKPSGVTVSADDDGTFSIFNTNTEYSSFMLQGTTYATTYDAAGNNAGTLRIYITQDDIACPSGSTVNSGIKKLQIIDSSNSSIDDAAKATIKDDGYGNTVITVNGTDYYYNDSEPTNAVVGGANLLTDLKWTVTCYDAKGFTVAQGDIQ